MRKEDVLGREARGAQMLVGVVDGMISDELAAPRMRSTTGRRQLRQHVIALGRRLQLGRRRPNLEGRVVACARRRYEYDGLEAVAVEATRLVVGRTALVVGCRRDR